MDKLIAIVDDDAELLELLSHKLTEYNYTVQTFATGEAVVQSIKDGCIYSLILLDVHIIGGEDGISICRKIKNLSDIPIIFLSSHDTVMDKVVGLEVGAEDYITKPYDFRELLTRIKVTLRRTKPIGQEFCGLYECETWSLDFAKRTVTYSDGSFVKLTVGFYDLLVFFINNKENIINRETIYQHLFQEKFESYDRRLDVRISQLRKTLDQNVKGSSYIETIKGVGYRFLTVPIAIDK